MITDFALSELIVVSDSISIIGQDYSLSFNKKDVSCDGSPEGGMIVFGFKYHTKTLFMDDVKHITWDANDKKLVIYEERKK